MTKEGDAFDRRVSRPMGDRQPNILLIMADQLSAPALPCYGHPLVKAPHIGALAERGVVFENAYCNSPLCAPSRSSFMAGRLASRIGAYDNASEFPSAVPTIAHGLRAQGYRTCLSGKMHFVGPDQLHGFEERLTTDVYPVDFGWTPNWDAPEERIDWWYHNMASVKEAGVAEASNQLDFDDETGFQAMRFLSDYARSNKDRPFFLTVSFTHPHDPYAIRQEHWDRYEGIEIDAPRVAPIPYERMDAHSRRLVKVSAMDEVEITEEDVRRARRAYYGAISYLDGWIGELIRALRTFRLADETVVVLTSDHGDMLGERGLWYKMCFFERAVRVPLIFFAPERFAPRGVGTLASLVDLLPTLLDLGRPASGLPAGIEHDGHSLAAALDGSDLGERTVLGEYMAEGALAPILMIRRGQWKYVWSEADPPMLLDLEHDPDELENLAAQPEHAATAAAFEAEVHQLWNPKDLYEKILRSQRARRLAFGALTTGRHTPWDYQPVRDASREYMRNHLDLNQVERGRRFPRAD
jgi:choline-sulfatase